MGTYKRVVSRKAKRNVLDTTHYKTVREFYQQWFIFKLFLLYTNKIKLVFVIY